MGQVTSVTVCYRPGEKCYRNLMQVIACRRPDRPVPCDRHPTRAHSVSTPISAYNCVLLPGLGQQLGELAASVLGVTVGTSTTHTTIAVVETLTDGFLEDAFAAFEPAVAAIDGGVVVRRQQRAFTQLVMRALRVETVLADQDAEKAGARLLKQASKVRASVAKACSAGDSDKIDALRRVPYPAAGMPPLPWEPSAPPLPAPAPVPEPISAPASTHTTTTSPMQEELPEERRKRVKIPLHWQRRLGTDACAYVEEYYKEVLSDDDDDVDLDADCLLLIVRSLVRDRGDVQEAERRVRAAAEAEVAAADAQAAAADDRAARATEHANENYRMLQEQVDVSDERRKSHHEECVRLLNQAHTAEERAHARLPQLLDEMYKDTLDRKLKERTEGLEEQLRLERERADFFEARLEGRMQARSSA